MRRMATTQARPGLPPPLFRARSLAEQVRGTPPLLLAAALGVAVLYAAFANGAIGIPDETRLQVGIASVSILAIAALLFGRTLGAAARSPAYGGLILLGGFDLNPSTGISRLREPIGYWNALALFLVMAVPAGLAAAADLARSERARLVSLLALVPLLTGIVLALSRGALLTLVAALLVQLALSEERGRLLPLAGIAAAVSVPAIVLGLTLSDLTSDNVSVHDRTDDGFVLLVALLGGLVAVAALGRVAIRTRAL